MLISHDEIEELLEMEVVEYSDPSLINSASLDIRLGLEILVERPLPTWTPNDEKLGLRRVSLKNRDPLHMIRWNLKDQGPFILYPGEFILAHSFEIFHLPNYLSAQYALKSSMARIGLEHLNAGWCDAGWYGSALTLELKNITRYHEIVLEYKDKIGQMIFFKHKTVKEEHSYASRGRYNGDKTVTGAKKSLLERELEASETEEELDTEEDELKKAFEDYAEGIGNND